MVVLRQQRQSKLSHVQNYESDSETSSEEGSIYGEKIDYSMDSIPLTIGDINNLKFNEVIEFTYCGLNSTFAYIYQHLGGISGNLSIKNTNYPQLGSYYTFSVFDIETNEFYLVKDGYIKELEKYWFQLPGETLVGHNKQFISGKIEKLT